MASAELNVQNIRLLIADGVQLVRGEAGLTYAAITLSMRCVSAQTEVKTLVLRCMWGFTCARKCEHTANLQFSARYVPSLLDFTFTRCYFRRLLPNDVKLLSPGTLTKIIALFYPGQKVENWCLVVQCNNYESSNDMEVGQCRDMLHLCRMRKRTLYTSTAQILKNKNYSSLSVLAFFRGSESLPWTILESILPLLKGSVPHFIPGSPLFLKLFSMIS